MNTRPPTLQQQQNKVVRLQLRAESLQAKLASQFRKSATDKRKLQETIDDLNVERRILYRMKDD